MLKIAAVIGWPVEQSLSPIVHNYWLQKYGLAGHYEKIAVSPDQLSLRLNQFKKTHSGLSVTLPHKETIIPLLDHITPVAGMIRAVNCVTIQPNGSLLGDNTDAYGFSENLCQRTNRRDWAGANAIILGAGGAARGGGSRFT